MYRRDQDLLDDLRCGSRGLRARAFATLYDEYGLRLLSFARRLSRGDSDLAVDLVQDTWLALLDELAARRLVLRNDEVGGFLVTLLRRQAARRFRRTGEVLMDSVDSSPAPTRSMAQSLDRHALMVRLESNPSRYPIHHALLVQHQDNADVKQDWCRRTGSGTSAFYKSRRREFDELRDDAGLGPARVDA